ncbi:hypothetical protein GCM10011610_27160 [Nocardia rhizosphaerihabitans]|uniref:Uncharacterized protein n=1 Tax=Nocardia rhizosphaerihabitans TaxID=1691570 RepID=A0ABQ2KEF4_9NOCA|nr:hypothetical protein GCM10011610_27160 [Nocardia rhizosphaerihabitans]
MILLIALLAAGAILALGTPAVLRRIDFGGAPVVGIVAWMGAVSATIAVGVLALAAWRGRETHLATHWWVRSHRASPRSSSRSSPGQRT